MSLELNQNQKSLADIQKIIESLNCPDEIQIIKDYVKILKKESAFYLSSKLLNLTRNKLLKLRQSESNTPEQTWWQVETAQDEVWMVQQLALCIYKNEEI